MKKETNTNSHWVQVDGIVIRGYGAASGRSLGSEAEGTIAQQIPHFRELGLDLSDCYPATINVSIAPMEFTIHNPRYEFNGVAWTQDHAPEDFSFCQCRLRVRGAMYDALLYYPHPETKPGHFHPRSTAEIVSRYIGGITPGTNVSLFLDSTEVRITGGH